MNDIGFAKDVVNQKKIKELLITEEGKNLISQGLMFLFVRIPNLLGIKEEISDINKQDIKELILNHFKGISLLEIDYAFKMERYSKYDVKTEHYQLFNAEYVSSILNKYKKWLTKTRYENNIPLSITENKTPELSEKEKKERTIRGVLNCFKDYQKDKTVMAGYVWVYDYLDSKGFIDFSKEEKKKNMVIAKSKEKAEANPDKAGYKNRLSMIESKNSSLVINRAKRLLLENYFNNESLESLTEKIKN